MEVTILGTQYRISIDKTDKKLREHNCDGFCDKTTKRIVVDDMSDSDLDDPEWYKRLVMRHEIVHAFFYESGLFQNFEPGHDEILVDWIAAQVPKMMAAFQSAQALDQ